MEGVVMARGYIYEVSENLEDLGMMKEYDFFKTPGFSFADAYKDMQEAEAEQVTAGLLQGFRGFGARVLLKEGRLGFAFSGEARRSYFRPKFNRAKELLEKMTLEEFSTSDPFSLRRAIRNNCEDAVYYDYMFLPLDDFIREYMKEGTEYYVGNVVLMH